MSDSVDRARQQGEHSRNSEVVRTTTHFFGQNPCYTRRTASSHAKTRIARTHSEPSQFAQTIQTKANPTPHPTMKFILAALFAGSAAAFAPAQTGKASTALNAAAEYESYPGVLDPVGFFDPLGLADKADPALFKKYREAELTHGRVGKFSPIACFGTHSIHLARERV